MLESKTLKSTMPEAELPEVDTNMPEAKILQPSDPSVLVMVEEISNLTGGFVEFKPAAEAEEIIRTIFKYLKQFVTDKNTVYETNCRLLNQIIASKQDAKRLRYGLCVRISNITVIYSFNSCASDS